MTELRLNVPTDNNKVDRVRAGDILYVTGDITIARDQAHKKLLDTFVPELTGLPIFHCGPIAKKAGDGGWKIVAGGPTTSTRMDWLTPPILERYHNKIIIGKGGLGEVGKKGLATFGAIYSEFTGGASALAVSKIVRVKKRLLEDLGPTELVWIWEVKDFGPLLVTQDHQGNDIKKLVTTQATAKLETIVKTYA
ncbi:MAG TPA: fumarate hydratase C-terminal domain-containing protein [Candidatus Acidoferrales bacterium]|nr:fumarate hydratase C-terminal domain-containing protein [Candidatus Acidoferrales bacterium]